MSVVDFEDIRGEAREMRERARFQRRRASAAVRRAGEQQAAFIDFWLRARVVDPPLAPGRKAAIELREMLRSVVGEEHPLATPKERTMARVAVRALRRYEAGRPGTGPS